MLMNGYLVKVVYSDSKKHDSQIKTRLSHIIISSCVEELDKNISDFFGKHFPYGDDGYYIEDITPLQ